MKGKYLPFLILPVSLFVFFLASPLAVKGFVLIEEDWRDSSTCEAVCGTTVGSKTQTLYEKVCEEVCPTRQFSASETFYEEDFVTYSNWSNWSSCDYDNKCSSSSRNAGTCQDSDDSCGSRMDKKRTRSIINAHACPAGYTYQEQNRLDDCYKTVAFGPINVVYGLKSNDPNKCHRPTGVSLDVPSWAMSDFNKLPEHIKDSIEVNCRQEATSTTRTVSCEAELIACEGTCPIECGYEGGLLPDGQGGEKVCPATNSCSTYRWCFPDEESTTGYLAQALSISIPTPKVGKPWDSGKMLDIYCSYTPAGTCPTACGLPASEVDDGEGGKIACPATAACPTGEVLSATDEVKDTTSDEAVLGTTSVVLAETGASDNILVYVVQTVLMLSTLISGTLFVKKYII